MRPGPDERFSPRTQAALADAVAHYYSGSDLDVLFLRLNCENCDEFEGGGRGNKTQRVLEVVKTLRWRDTPSEDLLELARQLLEVRLKERAQDVFGNVLESLQELVASLRVDGYEFVGGKLVATTPGPAPMAAEVTLLETQLKERGLETAARHYTQAVDGYVRGDLETSNGQLRSSLEEVLLQLSSTATGKAAQDPKGAADQLRAAGIIDGDEANLLKGLVGISNREGAHAGLTTAEEALFRIHFSTAVARWLLAVVPP